MPGQLITCLNCETEFEAGDVLTDSIRAQPRTKIEADLIKRLEDVTKWLNAAKRAEKELAERAVPIDNAIGESRDTELGRDSGAVARREACHIDCSGK